MKPHGWEQAAGAYGQPGHYSVADIDGPDSLAAVRAYKKEQKARAKATRGGDSAPPGASSSR